MLGWVKATFILRLIVLHHPDLPEYSIQHALYYEFVTWLVAQALFHALRECQSLSPLLFFRRVCLWSWVTSLYAMISILPIFLRVTCACFQDSALFSPELHSVSCSGIDLAICLTARLLVGFFSCSVGCRLSQGLQWTECLCAPKIHILKP